MSTAAAEDPKVAVIIGAFHRETFLPRAVRSVLGQTLPRDRFEVVVVKDFAHEALDRSLRAEGVTTIRDADPRIGRWLLRAVRATRAPLIALLDDDDEWEPERLARVVEVFGDHPEMGLYRNRVRVIDRDGGPVPTENWRRLESDVAFDATGPLLIPPGPKEGIVELASVRTRVTFNSSTMVVRRELLEGAWGDAFARTQLPDLALFLAAALGPYGLFLDDRRLTRFRRYDGNVTLRSAWLGEAARSYREGAELARARGRPDFESWLGATAVSYERQFRAKELFERMGAGASRTDVARLTAAYLRFYLRHPAGRRAIVDVGTTELYGLAYCVAPGLTRRARAARGPGPTGGAS
jgi:glycosyltransferase involved in cell wall biosynthesis